MKIVVEIFSKPPYQWGLRGDPHLWDELKEYFQDNKFPETASQFEKILLEAFDALIADGVTRSTKKMLHIERYPRNGMSGGIISIEWWQEKGLPLLKKMFDCCLILFL